MPTRHYGPIAGVPVGATGHTSDRLDVHCIPCDPFREAVSAGELRCGSRLLTAVEKQRRYLGATSRRPAVAELPPLKRHHFQRDNPGFRVARSQSAQ